MKIVFIILAFAIHFLTMFLVLYCFDEPEIEKRFPFKIKKPSLYDLDFIKNTEFRFVDKREDKITYELYELVSHHFKQLESYSQNVIADSHKYFSLKSDVSYSEDLNGAFSKPTLLISSYILVFLSTRKLFDFSLVIIALCVLLLCVLGDIIIYKIYRCKLSIPKFEYNESTLKEHFSRSYDVNYDRFHDAYYDISPETAYNNYLLEKHYHYLSSIEETIIFRSSLRKILVALSIGIYVLFFWQIPQ